MAGKFPSLLPHFYSVTYVSPFQVKSGTIFDNILITDDEAYAERVGEETWGVTKVGEQQMKDKADEEEAKLREEEAKKQEGRFS